MDSLYSAFVIDAELHRQGINTQFNLFEYSMGQVLVGHTMAARRIHTNMPRSGYNGLPTGWAMQVSRWRASVNMRYLVEPVLEWAADTHLRFYIQSRPIAYSPLADLLLAPQQISDAGGSRSAQEIYQATARGERLDGRPILLAENINFTVEVEFGTQAVQRMLMNYLVERAVDLNGNRDDVSGELKPRLTCWVWLEGALAKQV